MRINTTPGVELEYFEIIKEQDLRRSTLGVHGDEIIGCVAARVGKIRLIDNINFSS